MSFAEARRREYLTSIAGSRHQRTEVRFANTKVGGLEIAIVAKSRRMAEADNLSEDEVERQLAQEGLIRMPSDKKRTRDEFPPIDVSGKPISEIIVEERR
jgi:hypothetical protein